MSRRGWRSSAIWGESTRKRPRSRVPTTKTALQPLRTEVDIVQARHLVRKLASELALSLVDQTKIVTAASELARNTIVYGKGGDMQANVLETGLKRGLELIFTDKGP